MMQKHHTQHSQHIQGQQKYNGGAPAKISNASSPSASRRPSIVAGNFPAQIVGQNRPSTVINNNVLSLSVAASPPPATPGASSGAFRALRSLLPFGGGPNNKNASSSATANSSTATPASVGRTSSFTFGIGNVRKSMSMTRERKGSLSIVAGNGGPSGVAEPVMAIERSKSESQMDPDVNLRRSVSLSRLEAATSYEPESPRNSAPMLRTPSPGLPLSLELSTIIEADSSGVLSKTQGSSATCGDSNATSEGDADASLQLSPSNLTSEVLEAINAADSPSVARDWSRAGQAVIIDADTDSQPVSPRIGEESFTENLPTADGSFLSSVDPALDALLSPNRFRKPSHLPRLSHSSPSRSPRSSPSTPTSRRFPSSPTSGRFTNNTSPTRPRFLNSPPRTPKSSSPATPHGSPLKGTFPSPQLQSKSSNLPPTSTPAAKRHHTTQSSSRMFTPTAVSSLSVSSGARMLNRSSSAAAKSSSNMIGASGSGSTQKQQSYVTSIGKGRPPKQSLQTIIGREPSSDEVVVYPHSEATPTQQQHPVPRIALSCPPSPTRRVPPPSLATRARSPGSSLDRRAPMSGRPLETPRRPSLDLSRRAMETPVGGLRRSSFELRRRELRSNSLSRSTNSSTANLTRPTNSSVSLARSTTSISASVAPLDPTTPRPSMDSRLNGVKMTVRRGLGLRPRTPPSQRSPVAEDRMSSALPAGRTSPIRRSAVSDFKDSRRRKRSMSVQESNGPPIPMGEDDGRPSSSMSYTKGSRQVWAGRGAGRVLRAAGLLDRDSGSALGSREDLAADDFAPPPHYPYQGSSFSRHQRNRSGGSMGPLAPSPLGGGGPAGASSTGRYGSVRAASEYNPTASGRAQSRMSHSDAAGPSLAARRSSGLFPRAEREKDFGSRDRDRDGRRELETGVERRGSHTSIDSPSSGGRDSRDGYSHANTTPRSGASIVTAATSMSNYLGRDRERDGDRFGDRETVISARETLSGRETVSSRERDRERELRDRHAKEMAALLSALADSQATAKLLREENADLRERVQRASAIRTEADLLENENQDLRAENDELTTENEGFRAENEDLKAENEELRGENEELRRVVSELRQECLERRSRQDELRREVDGLSLRASTGSRRGVGSGLTASPPRQSGFGNSTSGGASTFWNSSTPKKGAPAVFRFGSTGEGDTTEIKQGEDSAVMDWNRALRGSTTPQDSPERGTMIIHDLSGAHQPEQAYDQQPFDEDEDAKGDFLPEYLTSNTTSDTTTNTHHTLQARRLSSSSSIFPLPPANMSLLINEDAYGWDGHSWITSNRSSPYTNGNTFQRGTSSSVKSNHSYMHRTAGSIARNIARERDLRRDVNNVSPSIANFSMMTGGRASPTGSYGGRRSPDGSLFLKPEHELFLGDMESMDIELGAKVEAMKQMRVGPFGFVPAGEKDDL